MYHSNQAYNYPSFLVDKYVLFLTSYIPKRGKYINAISVPVSFEIIRLYLYFFKIKFSLMETNDWRTNCVGT